MYKKLASLLAGVCCALVLFAASAWRWALAQQAMHNTLPELRLKNIEAAEVAELKDVARLHAALATTDTTW